MPLLDPTISTALALLEISFPNNTREQNIDLLQSESYYLYESDGSVHGLITVDSMTNDKPVIFALAISADSQRKGFGSFMVRHLAAQLTCDKLYVQADNTAVPFYEKLGFDLATDEKSAEHCTAMVTDRSKLLSLDAVQPPTMHVKPHAFRAADIEGLPSVGEDPMDTRDDAVDGDKPVLPTGPLTAESKKLIGNGGCSAFALYKLDVFDSIESAKRALNRHGAQLLEQRRKRHGPTYERSRVYTEDDSWSSETIKLAVVAAGFDFKKLDLDSDDVCLKRDLKNGAYLLDGVQNQEWMKGPHIFVNALGYTPGPTEAPMHWRHAIAIKNGEVLEQNDDIFSTKWLWLNENNRPDVRRGYMREVLKVYIITKKLQYDKRSAELSAGSATKRPRVSKRAAAATANDTDVALLDGEIKIVFPTDPTDVMGINSLTLLDNLLETVPEAPGQNVEKHKAQWTMGNHPSLNGRTNKPMPRNKIFAQKGDPRSIGTRQYQYTGKQNRVDYMTCDVSKIPLLASMIKEYDAALPEGVPASNHYITTMYSDGTYCIDAHSDKDVTLDKESVITVVKLGPGSRKFIIRENTGTTTLGKILFDQVLPPGTIVQMTLKGNAMTTHEVPREPDNTEMSGSIVFRTSNLLYTPEQVQKRVAQSDKNINTVIHFVDPAADDSA